MNANTFEKRKYRYSILFCTAIMLILGILFFSKIIPEEKGKIKEVKEYNQSWYYVKDDERIAITYPLDMKLKRGETFTIYNDKIAPENAGKNIFLKNAIYRPEIYLDEVPLYQYDDGGLRRNPPELSYQLCIGRIKGNVAKGTVEIILHRSSNDTISLPEVYVGTTEAIITDLFFSNAYISVITITMIMLGFFALLVELITRKQNYAYKRKLLMLGLFLLTIGIWCVTDSPLVQYLFGYSNLNMYLDFFVFMFLLAPFIGHIKNINGMEKYKILECILILSFLNVIIQTILALLNVFTYIKMVPVTHSLIVAGVFVSIFLLYKEYRINKKREVFLCLRAFAIAGIFAVISIIMYFLKPELFYQNLFQTGLLLFVLILLWNILSEFIENLRYKAEAHIYRQLAEVDKLTNLKNRRGFDAKISEIAKTVERYDNVLLIFIDLNGLKRINDSYGHTKGDEILSAAAACMEDAYKNHGFCYRIGGDEFCAIIENPMFSEQDAIRFAEHEIQDYNQKLSQDCSISIAIGCSFLKESDGTVKAIEVWKKEADYKMYEDKKVKKFKMQ